MAIYMLIKTQFGFVRWIVWCWRSGKRASALPWKRFDCLNRLLNLATGAQAADEEGVDQKDDSADDGDGSGGAGEIHASGVGRPVVSLLRVAPILQDHDGTGGEQDEAHEVQHHGELPRNARN